MEIKNGFLFVAFVTNFYRVDSMIDPISIGVQTHSTKPNTGYRGMALRRAALYYPG